MPGALHIVIALRRSVSLLRFVFYSQELLMIIKPYTQYNEAEILPLYKSVGWRNYYEHPGMLPKAYAASLCILGA